MSRSLLDGGVRLNAKQVAGLEILVRESRTAATRASILHCCHSEKFAAEVVKALGAQESTLGLEELEKIVATAEGRMGEEDWLESFRGHPAIGGKCRGTGEERSDVCARLPFPSSAPLFCPAPICSVLLCSVLFCSVLFCFGLPWSVQL